MNCIIAHGCPRNPVTDPNKRSYDKHWMPWLKEELSKNNVKTFIPLMPSPWKPNYKEWKKEFDKLKINEESILIGHSCGCAFLVRWLGDTGEKIKKLILVAPWKISTGENMEEKDFYEYQISDSVKFNIGSAVIFTSNGEEEDGKKSAKIFQENLSGKLIELKDHGHYCLDNMETEEFPELLEEVLK